jgi:hypothetical protein
MNGEKSGDYRGFDGQMKRIIGEMDKIRSQLEGNHEVGVNKMEDVPLLMRSEKIQAILNEERKKDSENQRMNNIHLVVR